MAVASLMTTFSDLEGTPTFAGYGGGQGATVNTDIFIQGSQSGGRRSDNATDAGFGVQVTAVDMSAAGMHVKAWVFITQWPQVTALKLRISSGADDDHTLPAINYPPLGGFVPIWCDVSRTPETGGSANEASINEIGVAVTIGDVGGNAQNVILDEVLYGTSGLRWTASSGELQDFRDFEDTNNEGNLITLNGIDFCYSRLEIGNSGGTLTTFTDSGFNLTFPDQPLVAADFMGMTTYLTNASNSVTLSNATIQSSNPASASRRPDFIVSGTTGTLELNTMILLGLRLAQLTSAVTIDGGILDAVEITQAGAEIANANIQTRSASGVAAIDDATFGTASGIHDCRIAQQGAGHAIELTSTGSITLTNIDFAGFGGTTGSNGTPASGANDAAIYNNSGGAVTINVSGGTVPSVRNGAGATTTVLTAQRSVTINNVPAGAEWRLYEDSGVTGQLGTVELDGAETHGGGAITYTYSYLGDEPAVLQVIADGFEEYQNYFTLVDGDQTINVTLQTETNL